MLQVLSLSIYYNIFAINYWCLLHFSVLFSELSAANISHFFQAVRLHPLIWRTGSESPYHFHMQLNIHYSGFSGIIAEVVAHPMHLCSIPPWRLHSIHWAVETICVGMYELMSVDRDESRWGWWPSAGWVGGYSRKFPEGEKTGKPRSHHWRGRGNESNAPLKKWLVFRTVPETGDWGCRWRASSWVDESVCSSGSVVRI